MDGSARGSAAAATGPQEWGAGRVWFTDRSGGVSEAPYDTLNLGGHVGDDPAAVEENRRRAAATFGVPSSGVVWMEQVHGRRVAVVEAPAAGPIAGVDALVTRSPELTLAVLVADCVPVLLLCPPPPDGTAGPIIAAVHAGRRGVQLGIVDAVLREMASLGGESRRVRAWLGPAVCGRCYEVPAAMQAEVAAVAPAAATTSRMGTPALDLRAGLVGQLRAAGVGAVRVHPACTVESRELYSHRRDQRTGRFAGFITLAPTGTGPADDD